MASTAEIRESACIPEPSTATADFSIYAHIPYCDSKCPYCDFNSHATRRCPEEAYTVALMRELEAAAQSDLWLDRPVATIFIGGGTPSLFQPQWIASLLHCVRQHWAIAAGAEITLECNPGSTDRARLEGYRRAGVNRISIGAQSFHEDLLQRLGRIHGAKDTRQTVAAARSCGFENLNLDLMFAIPGQTLDDWRRDLARVADLRPTHVSAYNLTFEAGTSFYEWRERGDLSEAPDEIQATMFEEARAALPAAGYTQYEISNYAQPGRECRHNLRYWRAREYLGIGAGAHSFALRGDRGLRWSNVSAPALYIDRASAGSGVRCQSETLDRARMRSEYAFLGLRCRSGIDGDHFARRFGQAFEDAFPVCDTLRSGGLLEHEHGRWYLSERGLMMADAVFAELM